MANRRPPIPSPAKAGMVHAGVSFLTFAGIAAAGVAGVQFLGSSTSAGPTEVVGLFSVEAEMTPPLKTRLPETAALESVEPDAEVEPSLGVPDPGETVVQASVRQDVVSAGSKNVEVRSASAALPKAPIRAVEERVSDGYLPKISADGASPSKLYARPFANPAGRPTISVVVGGLGLNWRVTQAAIDELPPDVTLSFVPYARGLQTWVDKARAAGHEVLLEVPMEPYDYPNNDTGPSTLLTQASARENDRRLTWLMTQATGYFGLTNYQGAKFATDSGAVGPIFAAMKERGLVFIHDGAAPRSVLPQEAEKAGLGFAQADRVIDANPSAAFIDEQLLHLEAIALQRGSAMGSGFAYPVTIDQIREWTSTLDAKGYKLAPASALPRTTAVFASGPTGQGS